MSDQATGALIEVLKEQNKILRAIDDSINMLKNVVAQRD